MALEIVRRAILQASLKDRRKSPFLQTPFNESLGQFSPDGRWVAYTSNESGSGNQIYVQSFPAGSGKFLVSTGTGGEQPRWRRDGKELFYLGFDGRVEGVSVRLSPRP